MGEVHAAVPAAGRPGPVRPLTDLGAARGVPVVRRGRAVALPGRQSRGVGTLVFGTRRVEARSRRAASEPEPGRAV
nr:hypothetical protein StreXyl84_69290 [Streptomyces sp. Xyl84]